MPNGSPALSLEINQWQEFKQQYLNVGCLNFHQKRPVCFDQWSPVYLLSLSLLQRHWFLGAEPSIQIVIVNISFEFQVSLLFFGLCLQDSAVIFFNSNILEVCVVALSRLPGLFWSVISSNYTIIIVYFQNFDLEVYWFDFFCSALFCKLTNTTGIVQFERLWFYPMVPPPSPLQPPPQTAFSLAALAAAAIICHRMLSS